MLKVLVASSKGGAGKSTLATNLAAYFAVDGKNTVLVDADRQGSSLRWSEKRSVHQNAVLGVSGLRDPEVAPQAFHLEACPVFDREQLAGFKMDRHIEGSIHQSLLLHEAGASISMGMRLESLDQAAA